MFAELRTEQLFHSAQKLVLEAILKLLGPKIPEVLTFEINDIFVASRLVFKLHRKFVNYVQKNIASINDDILSHLKKFKKLSKTKSDLAIFFAELHQLFRMSSSAKGSFDESFLVKQVLNELAKDDRVPFLILGAQLQDKPESTLEDLEFRISEKILDVDTPSDHGPESSGDKVSEAEALFAQHRRLPYFRSLALVTQDKSTRFSSKDAKRSAINKYGSVPATNKFGSVPEFPTLKNKDMPPFVQKLDASIWDSWPERKQKKYSRMIREFKDNVKAMLCDEDEEDPEDHDPGAMLAAHRSWELYGSKSL
jgi:hypothetical protein